MGIYLNPGNENYKRSLASEIFVDKTEMLAKLNRFIETGNNYICVSRPRRFGKTVAQNMIAAYYSKGCNSREMFRNLKIAEVNGYDRYLNALFKSNTLRPAISLAYITGILPIVCDRVQSKLNNFREYTMLDAKNLAEYVGFTSGEVEEICREHGMDYKEVQSWYDGYRQHGFEIYNPESVVESVLSDYCDDYWGQTSTYAVISDRIRANFDNTRDDVIRMLSGEDVDVNVTSFLNTMTDFRTEDQAFTYLIHTGYLAYNREDRTCRIPNKEIRQEWYNAIAEDDEYKETDRIIRASKELVKETRRGNKDTCLPD